ncbi:MAG: hypothetical protein ABSA83_19060 [Verrucomicrobiota bacterium]|jgi:hypothetical protein
MAEMFEEIKPEKGVFSRRAYWMGSQPVLELFKIMDELFQSVQVVTSGGGGGAAPVVFGARESGEFARPCEVAGH